jgi:hypothetical protein
MRKLIICKNHDDLFSLTKDPYIGVSRGPIRTPISVSVEVIKLVLEQFNKPEIHEVTILEERKWPKPTTIYSEPVLLTLENYALPYEEIAGTKPVVKAKQFDFPSGGQIIDDVTPQISDEDKHEILEEVEDESIEVEIEDEVSEENTEEVEEVVETESETTEDAPVEVQSEEKEEVVETESEATDEEDSIDAEEQLDKVDESNVVDTKSTSKVKPKGQKRK